jgi:hypothetical protein
VLSVTNLEVFFLLIIIKKRVQIKFEVKLTRFLHGIDKFVKEVKQDKNIKGIKQFTHQPALGPRSGLWASPYV